MLGLSRGRWLRVGCIKKGQLGSVAAEKDTCKCLGVHCAEASGREQRGTSRNPITSVFWRIKRDLRSRERLWVVCGRHEAERAAGTSSQGAWRAGLRLGLVLGELGALGGLQAGRATAGEVVITG